MLMRTAGWSLLLVLAAATAPAIADPPPPAADDSDATDAALDPDSMAERYHAAEVQLYDALAHDASPRMQVLAGRIYLSDADEETPAALRPKRADVVARAAQLAPNDAYVQWVAASQGSYANSQCGPTRWPTAEVANLLRLEPDNSAAWSFAVALASAKGDQNGVDLALSRMAAATTADDHSGEETATWAKAYAAHPDAIPPYLSMMHRDKGKATTESSALFAALQRVDSTYSSAMTALAQVCKPDPSAEITWQRAAWCADAGAVLAAKGTSLPLRAQGLVLLGIAGDRSDAVMDLQRSHDWLEAHSANPQQNYEAMRDTPADLLGDWRGGVDEITATGRRLARTHQSATAPAGWSKASAATSEPSEDAGADAAQTAWQEYIKSVLADMRASDNARARVLAMVSSFDSDDVANSSQDRSTSDASRNSAKPSIDPVADLAAANPDNLLVQWIAANHMGKPVANAATNVQRLDPDNAASWELSLGNDDASDARTLQRMATTKRYDTHFAEISGAFAVAFEKIPVPAEAIEAARIQSPKDTPDATLIADTIAMSFASMIGNAGFVKTGSACKQAKSANDAQLKQACIAVARIMLHASTSVIAAHTGENMLRRFDALDANDSQRARSVSWWTSARNKRELAGLGAFIADIQSTGSEIEAMRLAAARDGATEPPADWQSPGEKQAAKAAKSR